MEWSELKKELIERINVREVYESIGARFTVNEPSAKGWLSCHALGREDKTPSAAVNVESGYYRDLGAEGDALSIWDALTKYGEFPTWLDAFKHHAKVHGLSRRLPKKHRDEAADKLDFVTGWNSLTIRGMLKKYPEFTEEAIRLTGGVQAKYPAKSKDPTYTVSWPVYGQGLLNVPPIGWVAEACDGSEIQLFQGKGQPAKPTKRVNVGGSKAGLVGRYAIRQLMKPKASPDWIFKVEGMSDLITLQSIIPKDQREKVLVVTNSAGCSDTKTPAECGPLFSGHNLVILHDSDEPGQNGAKLWLGMVGKYAKTIRNLILHEEGIKEKHGRDLRDWVSQGGTFEELVQYAGETKPFTAGEDVGDDGTDGSLTGPQAILKRLGIVVLGHIGTSNKVSFFTVRDGRQWEIRDISRYKVEDLIMHLGWETVEENVNTSNEPDPAKVTLPQIRRALAAQANVRRVTDGAVSIPEIMPFGQLRKLHPMQSTVLIEGLLRIGETLNLIAHSKQGKSWLTLQLSLSIACGQKWFGRTVKTGRVLIIDNELHANTLSWRLPAVASALGISPSEYESQIDVVSLRGCLVDIESLRLLIEKIERGHYSLVILDAWYRFYPPGVSENDNSAMAQLYNLIDQYAALTDAALILVHHASKGDQGDKRVTDVGSGAGSQSRAADSHIVLRDHQEENHAVLAAAVRSFPPVKPITIRFKWPLWHLATDVDPSQLASPQARKQAASDIKGISAIEKVLCDKNDWMTARAIRGGAGMGPDRCMRLLAIMLRKESIRKRDLELRNPPITEYRLSTTDGHPESDPEGKQDEELPFNSAQELFDH